MPKRLPCFITRLYFVSAERAAGFELLEEVVAFVVHEDECREVFHFDFPDGFHAQFGVLEEFDILDGVLGEDRCRAAD